VAYYVDCDGDGYGTDASLVSRCGAPVGVPPGCPHGLYAMVGGDCDDANVGAFPGMGCTPLPPPDAGVDAGGTDAGPPDLAVHAGPVDGHLSSLAPADGTLSPTFASGTTMYRLTLPEGVTSTTFVPTSPFPGHVTITVDGMPVASGGTSIAVTGFLHATA